MKTGRVGFRMLRREQLMQELVHDAYKSRRKHRGFTLCPDCGAVFHDGRWTWGSAPGGADEERCPACQRVHDRFPLGFVTIGGAFFAAHRDDVLSTVKNCELAAKREHALERIMAIEETPGGVRVSTTDPHLARRIGDALYAAYKGELEYRYNKDDNLLRVAWQR